MVVYMHGYIIMHTIYNVKIKKKKKKDDICKLIGVSPHYNCRVN
jgi:hypothetical protein